MFPVAHLGPLEEFLSLGSLLSPVLRSPTHSLPYALSSAEPLVGGHITVHQLLDGGAALPQPCTTFPTVAKQLAEHLPGSRCSLMTHRCVAQEQWVLMGL